VKLASVAILAVTVVLSAATGTSAGAPTPPAAVTAGPSVANGTPPVGSVRVDAQAEVAAVLYAASATQAALAKSVDARLKGQQDRINTLAAQIKAGDTRHRAEMAVAQEAFITQLAQKDREYAVQIGLFRNTVTDIAATPEGVTALERFNEGDEIGAISILDRLRATNEKMRETRARLEDAAEGRRIARLALEARTRGKLTTQAVIGRFEEVVRLDPGVGDDWLQLDRLYQDAGQLAQAKKATDSFEAAAHDDRERALASSERADVLQVMGDLAGARAAAERAVAISRKMLQADPKNLELEYTFSRALVTFGEIVRSQGDLLTAQKSYTEEIEMARRRIAADPKDFRARNGLGADMLHLADVLLARGHVTEARQAAEEDLHLMRGLAADAPESLLYPREASVSLMWLSDIYVSQGSFEDARKANTEIVATSTKLTAADPNNAISQRDLVYGLTKTAYVQRIEGDFDTALKTDQHALQISRELAKPANSASNLRQDVATELVSIADLKRLRNDFQGSQEAAREAVTILQSLMAADPTDVNNKQFLAQALYSQGASLAGLADARQAHEEGARQALEQGLKLDQALLAANSDAQQVNSDLSDGYLAMGRLQLTQDNTPGALKSLEQSLEIRRQLARAQPGSSAPERAVAEAMRALVDLPGSKVKWADFKTQVEAMDRNGILWPADRAWLAEAHQHDLREAAR
jgi:tetratricopeptide (TPR) repeat protein